MKHFAVILKKCSVKRCKNLDFLKSVDYSTSTVKHIKLEDFLMMEEL